MATTEETTEQDVAAAEDAAREAEELALSLEQQVAAGDDSVTREQLEAQRSEASFALLRVKGARAKLAAARQRQHDLVPLKAEIEAYEAAIVGELTGLFQAWCDAEAAFIAAAVEHDTKIEDFKKRAADLGAPAGDGRLVDPNHPDQIRLGRSNQEALVVGRRRLKWIGGKSFIARAKGWADGRGPGPELAAAMLADLQRTDAEATR